MMFSSTPTISTMQEFFKTAVSNTSTSRYNQSRKNSDDDIHRYNQNDSESKLFADESHTTTGTTSTSTASSSILPGSMNLFLPQHHDYKYGSGSGSAGKKNMHHGMSENDIKSVVYNTESFHIIQEQLRVNYKAQSNSVAKQVAIQLIREQYLQQQQLQLQKEQQLRQEQRQLQIARELTEARIKSRQALKLTVKGKHDSDSDNDDGDVGSHHEDDLDVNSKITSNSSNSSPTSVMSTCVSMPEIATDDTFMTAPLMSMNDEYDSEDGDIQEVVE